LERIGYHARMHRSGFLLKEVNCVSALHIVNVNWEEVNQ
jgi:hypothetical protein